MVIYQSHNMSHLLQLFKDLKSEKKSLEVSEERMKDALQEVMEVTCTPGHFLCWMLNTTYRTTKYGLSLFFLAVKTNVDTNVECYGGCENEDSVICTDIHQESQPQMDIQTFVVLIIL